MQCWSRDGRPAIANVIYPGSAVSMCKTCLDMRLDNADDEPSLEPSLIEWLEVNERRW